MYFSAYRISSPRDQIAVGLQRGMEQIRQALYGPGDVIFILGQAMAIQLMACRVLYRKCG